MMRRRCFELVLFVGLASCGSSMPDRPMAPTAANLVQRTPTSLPTPTDKIRRDDLRPVLARGVGSLLGRITLDVDHPVFRAHKFIGFRINELPPEWSRADIKPGDVVTAVNGFPVERPEQAQEAFDSLTVASELRVDYERAGEPRALRIAITDE